MRYTLWNALSVNTVFSCRVTLNAAIAMPTQRTRGKTDKNGIILHGDGQNIFALQFDGTDRKNSKESTPFLTAQYWL